jgi:hypothetical protein
MKMKERIPPKRWYLPIKPHGVTSQETKAVLILTTVENLETHNMFSAEICALLGFYAA